MDPAFVVSLDNVMFTLRSGLVAFLVCGFAVGSAQADLVTVGSIGTVNMAPNSQSSAIAIPIFDANTGTPVNLFAWSLGLRVVPLSGATGTVTIDQASLAYAANNILTDPFPSAGPQLTPNAPTTGDITIGSSSNAFNAYAVLNQAANQTLAGIKFNSSSDASGNFALQLVDSGALQSTYWTDDSFTDRGFQVNGAAFVSGAELGQIEVFAAVPEPGSLLLTGGLVACAAWRARRKRKAEAAPISSSDAASA